MSIGQLKKLIPHFEDINFVSIDNYEQSKYQLIDEYGSELYLKINYSNKCIDISTEKNFNVIYQSFYL